MTSSTQKPIFCAVLCDGQQWTVDAEWQDGTIEQIDVFKSYLEAIGWISNQSATWFRERVLAV
jgi:hypothetical protein